MLLCKKAQKQDSEVHTHLILQKKIFTFGGLSTVFYFHAAQKPCAFQVLRNNDFHNLMKPIVFFYQRTSTGLPNTPNKKIQQQNPGYNTGALHLKQCITNTFDSIHNDIWWKNVSDWCEKAFWWVKRKESRFRNISSNISLMTYKDF